MSLKLHTISSNDGARQKKQRVGRGVARKGKTSGRGHKGQRSRSGGKGGLKLKGLKKTLLRVPKLRGFKSLAPKMEVVNVGDLNRVKGAMITPKALKSAGLISDTSKGVKILSVGDVQNSVVVKGCKVSKVAAEKIIAAGGKVE
ncbi:50S ribosomal protein L15 [Candidatus Uhrbacteria bacterium]|nr:50S ribosomal protein L15 [Candidatus Uhrbacteria bacterium]